MTNTENFVIETVNLGKSYGSVQALNHVNLRVPPHSIFGFLGPNGAGKTTLMKILLGLCRPSAGSGTIFGYDILSKSVAIRERIGYLPQHPRFIDHMTARENLQFTAGFFYSGPQARVRERCEEMLALVGLADKADRPIKGFSGGEKQRLGIALAQLNYPDLLILDEPASALDPLGRQEVLEVMARLRQHTTIFYSTHILDDVQRISDRVAILNRGRLVAQGPIDQILSDQDGSTYQVSIKGRSDGLGRRLGRLPWVIHASEAQHNGMNTWQIKVSEDATAEEKLLRYILMDPQVSVTDFRRKQYELEEVFMEIVRGDGHDR